MTTIVTVPFNQGVVVVSDRLATDTSSMETYVCEDKTSPTLWYSVKNCELVVSGAGLSIGTEFLMYPFMEYFEHVTSYYNVLIELMNEGQFINYFNNVGASYLREKAKPMEVELYNGCSFILTVKTPKFIGCYKTSIPGGVCRGKISNITNLAGTGSGSRYVLGALMMQNRIKPLGEWSEDEALSWVKTFFADVVLRDLASSGVDGINCRMVYKNKKSKNIVL